MQRLIHENASLTLAKAGSDYELATSYVTIGGKTSVVPLEGVVLESCIKDGDQYVLFMTDDIPFEDSLHIHLLDAKLSLIDSVTIGGPYATGHFRNLQCRSAGKYSFEYFGDRVWELTVLPKRRLRIPYVSGPRGVSWQRGWCHVLKLSARLR